MVKLLFFLYLIVFVSVYSSFAQEDDKFIIHRRLKVVGEETHHVNTDFKGQQVYHVVCNYTDRGTSVPLTANITLDSSGEPFAVIIEGKTSRSQLINDSIQFQGLQAVVKQNTNMKLFDLQPNSFPIDGYAPATLQWLLIKYWLRKGKPNVIEGIPNGKIEIKEMGIDTILVKGNPLPFNSYALKNVIWGWEYLWTDMEGRLTALNTINAEGDKIEFINEKYIDILLPIARLSARNGVKNYPQNQKAHDNIAIVDCTILDIETGKELPNQTVIIKKGRIIWIGPNKKAKIPKNSNQIHAEGRSLLPGLWDMHAHFKQTEWGPAYIAAGITTVRDMGNEFEFINSVKSNIDQGKGIGPTILRAGIIDGVGPKTNGIVVAETIEEAVRVVQQYKAAGFEQIKLYGSLKPDIVASICKEAKRLDMKVTGHIPQDLTLRQTIDLGINQVAHISNISKELQFDKNTYEIDFNLNANHELLSYLKIRNIAVDPTLAIYELITRSLDSPITEIEPAFNTLPEALQSQLITLGMPPEQAQKRIPWMELQKKTVRMLAENNITLLAGTDMIIPGYSLYRELELYVESGLSPLKALQTATRDASLFMNMYNEVGSASRGKKADLILINGNPFKNISDIRKIDLVIKANYIYEPNEVRSLVGIK